MKWERIWYGMIRYDIDMAWIPCAAMNSLSIDRSIYLSIYYKWCGSVSLKIFFLSVSLVFFDSPCFCRQSVPSLVVFSSLFVFQGW